MNPLFDPRYLEFILIPWDVCVIVCIATFVVRKHELVGAFVRVGLVFIAIGLVGQIFNTSYRFFDVKQPELIRGLWIPRDIGIGIIAFRLLSIKSTLSKLLESINKA